MLLWNNRENLTREFNLPKKNNVLDGYKALLASESQAAEVLALSVGLVNKFIETRNNAEFLLERLGNHTLGMITGAAMAGMRTSVISDNIENHYREISAATKQKLPLVMNLLCERNHRQYHGEHDAVSMFASTAQEAVDFSLICHRIAELALMPSLNALDMETAFSMQPVELPEKNTILSFLGRGNRHIECPNGGQKILFGEKRRRIPMRMDLDRPATLGSEFSAAAALKAGIAEEVFFSEHLVNIVRQVFREYGELTGRSYSRLECYQVKNAQYVVVVQGAAAESLRPIIEWLREKDQIKVGMIKVNMTRPFPGASLANCLQGKKAVMVMERTDVSWSDIGPLQQLVRHSMDKALENGSTKGLYPNPGYPAYRKVTDRPQVYSSIYGTGGTMPTLGEFYSTFIQMAKKDPNRKFYLTAPAQEAGSRYPKLQIQSQRIDKEYAGACQKMVPESEPLRGFPEYWLESFALDLEREYKWVGDLCARTLADILKGQPKTFAFRLQRSLDYRLAVTNRKMRYLGLPDTVKVSAVSLANLDRSPSPMAYLRNGATVVIDGKADPKILWKILPEETREHIKTKKAHAYYLHLGESLENSDSPYQMLVAHARLGAFLFAVPGLEQSHIDNFIKNYRQLAPAYIYTEAEIENCIEALKFGVEKVEELNWSDAKAIESDEQQDVVPWTVRNAQGQNDFHDLGRHWAGVGYFHGNEKEKYLKPEPHQAVATVPARSSAFRDISKQRYRMPQLIGEKCTGCGMCWSVCPDSAIPGTIQDFSSMFHSALAKCSEESGELTQLPRLEKHLLLQAHQLVDKDSINQYRTLGKLWQDSFALVLEKTKPSEEKRKSMTEEFEKLYAIVEHFPIVKTGRFFNGPESKQRGSGVLLSIVINPNSCKGCMQCVLTCPENALESVSQNKPRLDIYRKNWELFHSLNVNYDLIETHIGKDLDSQVNHLLDKKAYFTLVGGDDAPPAYVEKNAVHLLSAATERIMGERYRNLTGRLANLIKQLETKMQGMINETVQIENWQKFSRNMRETGSKVDQDALAKAIDESKSPGELDKERLERISLLLDKARELHKLYQSGENGDGRSRMAMVAGDDCMEWGRQYPHSPYSFPCVFHPDAAGIATGLFKGLIKNLARDFCYIRMMELELGNAYNPKVHNKKWQSFDWPDFSPEERELCPPLLLVEKASKADWATIYSLISQRLPVKIAIVETGSPDGNMTFGLRSLLQQNCYVAQTTIAHPGHFISAVTEGVNASGPAVFYIYAPYTQQKPVELAKLAVESRTFPLWKYNPTQSQEEQLCLEGNPCVAEDWYHNITPAHWAIEEGSWKSHWHLMAASKWVSNMTSLPEYLNSSPDIQKNLVAIIEKTDLSFISLSHELADFGRERLMVWRLLKLMAKGSVERQVVPVAEFEEKMEAREQIIRAEYTERIEQLEKQHGAVYQQRIKEALLSFCKQSSSPESLKQTLKDFVQSK